MPPLLGVVIDYIGSLREIVPANKHIAFFENTRRCGFTANIGWKHIHVMNYIKIWYMFKI